MTTRFNQRVRLSNPRQYTRVFDEASRVSGRGFVVLYRKNCQQEARLGLAVAKKHLKLAHDRNRVKRLIRESFRQHHQKLNSIDIVVLVRPGIAKMSNFDIFTALEQIWAKLS